MARNVTWVLVTVIAGLAGCAKNDPAGPLLNRPADLMVLIPAGTFQMGDAPGALTKLRTSFRSTRFTSTSIR